MMKTAYFKAGPLMFWLLAATAPCLATGAQTRIPTPPLRPAEFGLAITESPPLQAPAQQICFDALRQAGHVAEMAPQPAPGEAACTIAEPVRLISLNMGAGGIVALPDRPVLSCAYATQVADFMTKVMAPLSTQAFGSNLRSVETGPGFDCRPRNHVAGGKVSAHGRGLAVDIAGFRLADGRRILVGADMKLPEQNYVATIRKAGCGWFTTILGPGADAAHANHLHFDMETHGSSNSYRLCQ